MLVLHFMGCCSPFYEMVYLPFMRCLFSILWDDCSLFYEMVYLPFMRCLFSILLDDCSPRCAMIALPIYEMIIPLFLDASLHFLIGSFLPPMGRSIHRFYVKVVSLLKWLVILEITIFFIHKYPTLQAPRLAPQHRE